MSPKALPRIVIVGAGFAGLAAARALAGAPAEITVVDRRNYHLFQPLLYQVATAALSPADIAWPIRRLLRGQGNARVIMGRVVDVDRAARSVLLEDGSRRAYDHLVLATGARHAYFGREEWEPHAPGLKKIDDATDIRRRVLTAFERAETETDPEERRRHLTFVVVGAGPTGVEMAGAIAELARHTLAADFRHVDPRLARVVLVEAGPRVLPAFDPSLSERAAEALARLGVELRLGSPVTDCGPHAVAIGAEHIPTATIVWAAGVAASPAGKWLGAETDRVGRVRVAPDLTLPGAPEISVLGDTAFVTGADGSPVPGVAPAAKQMGAYAGARLARIVRGLPPPPEPFRYRDAGAMATIGRGAAVAEIGRLRFSGFIAWLLWAVVHVYFLIGNQSRLAVAQNWIWTYLTYARGARLITGATTTHPLYRADQKRSAA
ncbi:MAG TPA: NAD(P)/FAD-dependent oxidoreductase [Paracoccaceae bacterium]|nr:NAD(P)/FAD-dependent oxidoreductase [Paracoccaceae bacterium]